MNEIQAMIDSIQGAVSSLAALWGQVSAFAGSIFGGNDTVGGIIAAIVGLVVIGGGALLARNFIEN